MAMQAVRLNFNFKNVRILQNVVGRGPYASVREARCDQLLCAAKCIYSVLLTSYGGDALVKRFDDAVEFYSQLRHPNIVQYLGTVRDPESGAPVLLMELMDGSLMHFLERSSEAFPLHTQVDISLDIAQALAYIHACGFIHCDVTCSDVLLKQKKAKLGGFGSIQRIQSTDLELCPGTPTFMPPEALADPPRYTEELDIFSFGVVILMIINKQWTEVDQHALQPEKLLELLDHHDHPLQHIFLDCLKLNPQDRPSAVELCERLEALKETRAYSDSVQWEKGGLNEALPAQHQAELQQQIQEKDAEITQLSEEARQARERLRTQGQMLQQTRVAKEALQQQVTESNTTRQQLLQEIQQHRQQVDVLRQQITESNVAQQQEVRLLRQQLNEKDHISAQEQQQLRQQLEASQRANAQLQQQVRTLQSRSQVPQIPSHQREFWEVPREEVEFDRERPKLLGSGAWGFVAEGKFQGQTVAVKCLHDAYIQTQAFVEVVRQEISVMSKLRHPNLVLLIAAVIDEEMGPLIVTELLEISLRKAYEKKRLVGASKLSIFRDVASALNYLHLHRHGPYIHRDVSSANVMLEAKPNNQWKAKLSDFGSAKLAQEAKTTGPGSRAYAAPEVCRENSGIPQTTKLDVYSYGVLVCEVITEQFPDRSDSTVFPQMLRSVQGSWLFMHGLITYCIHEHPNYRPTMAHILGEFDRITQQE